MDYPQINNAAKKYGSGQTDQNVVLNEGQVKAYMKISEQQQAAPDDLKVRNDKVSSSDEIDYAELMKDIE